MTETLTIVLLIVGIIALIVLTFGLIYAIALIRKTHIVMKKVDYLVEDFTYKSESLNIAVDAINKISNYVLTFDAISKKGLGAFVKLIVRNKNYFYDFVDKLKTNLSNSKQPKKPSSQKTAEKEIKPDPKKGKK